MTEIDLAATPESCYWGYLDASQPAVQVVDPGDVLRIEAVTHPAGVVAATVPLGSRPFGVAVSPDRAYYVTQLDASTLARGTFPAMSFPASVAVGTILPRFDEYPPQDE